ncbi:MAG: TrkH family potassium uptake protein [Rhodospirillaceae bacterium]|jgi:trk system potassium uptake protein|nr:TrkH family potassium uptake protein [Rhodospirillaceae bacterium]MBT5193245.1 TrkH family potassium uptake protein [Rhodospirillaceae bacterium]MBT5896334.1 TrkH family potassium uptake protein [Rhodospirillaceae bacterium]MBT6426246.1 TrkH family potassium uptake protein [Rhodospirillaceae bacterium]MBT7756722.1 TrkH family potassium uptake protein [Rhodospirillaceae bacterium]
MGEYRAVFLVNGVLLLILGLAMLVPAMLDARVGHPDWQVFLAAAFLTGFVGAALTITCWGSGENLHLRQAFVLTTTVWVVTPAFGALPFVFADLDLSYTDAFFEAMSGITTTGSTVISGLEYAPPGILIWRALLQWMGGIGIIVTAVAILPLLQVGGMQLFRMESSDASEKVLPRTAQIAGAISMIYLALSFICAFGYWAAGMPAFEAAAHAMTTIATGGFSTSDQSMGSYDSALIDYTAMAFMIIGSLPFLLYFQVLRGRPLALWRDSQVRWFFAILATAIAGMTFYQIGGNDRPAAEALRFTAFNVTSILTGTGYATDDYGQWGGFAVVMFFFVMFIGGCAGSTSCGIKIFRFQVLYAAARTQMGRLLQPHGVFVANFNRRPIPDSVMDSVMSFFFLFILSFAVIAVLLSLMGLDFLTAVSGAGTAIANVGPGLGPVIGPSGTFAPLPDMAKWLLAAGMLLGRLELLTVMVLFTRTFWRS